MHGRLPAECSAWSAQCWLLCWAQVQSMGQEAIQEVVRNLEEQRIRMYNRNLRIMQVSYRHNKPSLCLQPVAQHQQCHVAVVSCSSFVRLAPAAADWPHALGEASRERGHAQGAMAADVLRLLGRNPMLIAAWRCIPCARRRMPMLIQQGCCGADRWFITCAWPPIGNLPGKVGCGQVAATGEVKRFRQKNACRCVL